MEITNTMTNVNRLTAPERSTIAERSAPMAPANEENTAKSKQQSITPVSELMTIAAGGTVTYSIDGDVTELSAAAISYSESQAGDASHGEKQTSDAVSNIQEQTDPQATVTYTGSEPKTDSKDSYMTATNLFLQGNSDSKIKDQTGISQQELDAIKQSYEKTSEPAESGTGENILS